MDEIAGVYPGEEITTPPWGELGRVFTLGAVSLFSKAVLTVANTFEVRHEERIKQYVLDRSRDVGLVTVSNHTSTFDDPGVISSMLPWSFFLSEHSHKGVRWSMCAKEICYSNWAYSQFFRNGKVLPVDRRGGVEQPIMQIASNLLSAGDWVHVFPEGRVSFTGQLTPFRRGVGKLICDHVEQTGSPPVVLPFYHSGMGEVKQKNKLIFGVGKHVTVTVGEPIPIPDAICQKCRQHGGDKSHVWAQITQVVESAMKDLEASAPPNVDQVSNGAEAPKPTPA